VRDLYQPREKKKLRRILSDRGHKQPERLTQPAIFVSGGKRDELVLTPSGRMEREKKKTLGKKRNNLPAAK